MKEFQPKVYGGAIPEAQVEIIEDFECDGVAIEIVPQGKEPFPPPKGMRLVIFRETKPDSIGLGFYSELAKALN